MSDQFTMFGPMTSEGTRSVTSSPALDSGHTLSDSQGGRIHARSGPEVVLVRPSRVLAKERGLMTLVTSGLSGIPSSASVALESCLASNLMTRLDLAGSTLFVETWKRRATPLRRRYWEHTARALHTFDNGCTSVPTPKLPKYGHDMAKYRRDPGRKRPTDLETAAHLAQKIVWLATVATPSARDWKDTVGMAESGVDPDGSIRSRLDQLPRQAQLADIGPTATGGTERTGR